MRLSEWKSFLKDKGFAHKSLKVHGWDAFFRVHGDGVLQVIRKNSEKGRRFVDVGLFSMYGKILPQWLTCAGCIRRYEVLYLSGRSAYQLKQIGERDGVPVYTDDIIGIDEQIRFLCESGVPFLDSILTQRDMIEGIKKLEYRRQGHLWNDDLLYPAYLAVRDWNRADMVVSAILEQHNIDSGINCLSIVPAEERSIYAQYIRSKPPRKSQSEFDSMEMEYWDMLQHIRSRDEEWVAGYTMTNMKTNTALCAKKHII